MLKQLIFIKIVQELGFNVSKYLWRS